MIDVVDSILSPEGMLTRRADTFRLVEATWGFEGHRLLPREIGELVLSSGWNSIHKIEDAIMTVMGESAGFTRAWHQNVDDAGKVISTDWTFWQINDHSHPEILTLKDQDDTFENRLAISKLAYRIYADRDFTFNAWVAHTNGSYLKYLPAGVVGACNASAKARGLTPNPYVVLAK